MLGMKTYGGRSVSGEAPGGPGEAEGGNTIIRVKAASYPYFDPANPAPASYNEPAGNKWARIQVGVNKAGPTGPAVYVEADAYSSQWATYDFTVPLPPQMIQSVQVYFTNDHASKTDWTATGQDRNLEVDEIVFNAAGGSPITKDVATAIYVETASGAEIERGAGGIAKRNGYYDFRSIGADAGNPAPTNSPFLTVSGHNVLYRGGEIVLHGGNLRWDQPFTLSGEPVYTVEARQYIKSVPALCKAVFGQSFNYIRLNIAPGVHRWWKAQNEALYGELLDEFVDECLRQDIFVGINLWCVGGPDDVSADESWTSSAYRQSGRKFYDTNFADNKAQNVWMANRFKNRGHVFFSIWDEPLRKVISGGTAQAGGAGTITLASGANATTGYYNRWRIYLTGGAGSGSAAIINTYDGPSRVATIHGSWANGNPSSGTTYVFEDTFARLAPLWQEIIDAIRATGAKNIISVPGQHYSRDFRELFTHGTLTDPENQLVFRVHEFSLGEFSNADMFYTSNGANIFNTVPLDIGGYGWNPGGGGVPASAPPPGFATWMANWYSSGKASFAAFWDISKYNDGAMSDGFPVIGAPFVLNPMGVWVAANPPPGPKLKPSTGGAVTPSPPTTGGGGSTPSPPAVDRPWTYADYGRLTDSHVWNPLVESSVEVSAASVNAIADLSGNGKTLTPFSTGKPLYTLDINGKRGIQHPGTANVGLQNLTMSITGTDLYFAVVIKPGSPSVAGAQAVTIRSSDKTQSWNNVESADLLAVINSNDGWHAQRNVVYPGTAPLRIGTPFIYEVWFTGGREVIRVNGTQVADVAFAAAAFSSEWFGQGCAPGTGGGYNPFKGSLGTMILCRGHVPSADDRQRIIGRMAHDYAMTSVLPSDHPYKTTEPMVTASTPSPPPPTSPPPPSGSNPPPSNLNIFARDRVRIPRYEMEPWCTPTGITKQIFVSTNGSDSNTGNSESVPVRSFARALQRRREVGNGTEIIVMPGVYRGQSIYFPTSDSGTASQWNALRGYPGLSRPIIQAGPVWEAIRNDADYMWFDGLEMDGSRVGFTMPGGTYISSEAQWREWAYANRALHEGALQGDGLYIDGSLGNKSINNRSTHHILISDMVCHDFPGLGIGLRQVDWNVVEDCLCYNNANYSGYGKSGITDFESQMSYTDTTSNYGKVHRRNVLFGNEQIVESRFDGGRMFINDGNNLLIDRVSAYGYNRRILIESLVCFDAGAAGIGILTSSNVDVFSCTLYDNCQQLPGRAELLLYFSADNCRVFSCVMHATKNSTGFGISNGANNLSRGNNVIWSNSGSVQNATAQDRVQNPGFINPAGRDFRVRASSPAAGFAHPTLRARRDVMGRLPGSSVCAGAFFDAA